MQKSTEGSVALLAAAWSHLVKSNSHHMTVLFSLWFNSTHNTSDVYFEDPQLWCEGAFATPLLPPWLPLAGGCSEPTANFHLAASRLCKRADTCSCGTGSTRLKGRQGYCDFNLKLLHWEKKIMIVEQVSYEQWSYSSLWECCGSYLKYMVAWGKGHEGCD